MTYLKQHLWQKVYWKMIVNGSNVIECQFNKDNQLVSITFCNNIDVLHFNISIGSLN